MSQFEEIEIAFLIKFNKLNLRYFAKSNLEWYCDSWLLPLVFSPIVHSQKLATLHSTTSRAGMVRSRLLVSRLATVYVVLSSSSTRNVGGSTVASDPYTSSSAQKRHEWRGGKKAEG